MRYSFIVSATACLLSVLSLNAQVIPLDTAVHTGKLANGFTYYIRHNEEPQHRVFLYLVNKVGSVLEADDQQGLAHFMEHMNFNGTTHFPKNELVNYLQKAGVRFGADLNAYTSFDETVFQLPIPSDDPVILKNGFLIMRDWAQGATLDSTEISKERGVVLEESRLGKGASDRMERLYFPMILNHSRYAERLAIGKDEIIAHFKPATIRRFFHDWYRPDLQALVVVGDIDVQKTELLVKKLFSDLKNPVNEKKRTEYKVPLTGQNQFMAITDPEMPVTQFQLMFKHPGEELVAEPQYIHSMEHQLFNQMLGERLGELSQKPNPPFLGAEANISDFLAGLDMFTVAITGKSGVYKEGVESVWEVIEKVKRYGFTQTELDRAKQGYLSQMEGAFREKGKTNSAGFVGEYQRLFLEREGSPGIDWEYHFVKSHIGDIRLQDVNQLAADYIKDQNRDILILAPASAKSSLPDSATFMSWINDVSHETLTAFEDNVSRQSLLAVPPAPGKITGQKTNLALDLTEFTLSNGAKVILKPTDFKNDEIRFAAFAPGGSSLYSDSDYMSAANAGLIAGFGLDSLDPVQLTKLLTAKRVELTPYIGERAQGMQGSSAPEDLETAMQLLYLRFTKPRKDSVLFNNMIVGANEMLATRSNDPNTVFGDTVSSVLGNYHFRRRPISADRLRMIDLDKSFASYQERFSDASAFTFVFVGSFSVDSLRPLIEKYIASLPATRKNEQARDLGIQISPGQSTHKVFRGTENKASVKIVYSGDYEFSAENNFALNALKEILQIKVIEHLREDESEVYGVGVQVNNSKYPKARYTFSISFGCAPANVDHLIDDVNREFAALRDKGPQPADLEKFKAEFKRNRELQLKNNGFWLSYLQQQVEIGEDVNQVQDVDKKLNQLTPASLQKAARTYLTGVNQIRFELLPEKP